MSTTNIKPIGSHGITPRFILEKVASQVDDMEEMFVVAFDLEGKPHIWAAGDLRSAALAGNLLNELSLDAVWGRVDEYTGPGKVT
jgi:hypothetical protein